MWKTDFLMIKLGPEMNNFDWNSLFENWCAKKDRYIFLPKVLKNVTESENA